MSVRSLRTARDGTDHFHERLSMTTYSPRPACAGLSARSNYDKRLIYCHRLSPRLHRVRSKSDQRLASSALASQPRGLTLDTSRQRQAPAARCSQFAFGALHNTAKRHDTATDHDAASRHVVAARTSGAARHATTIRGVLVWKISLAQPCWIIDVVRAALVYFLRSISWYRPHSGKLFHGKVQSVADGLGKRQCE